MRYFMTFSYDGTNYKGYQKQPKVKTIQGEIEKKLKKINNDKKVDIHASGRTDAHVHALNQKAHFDLDSNIEPENLKKALNSLLPSDIYIKSIVEVNDDFMLLVKNIYIRLIWENTILLKKIMFINTIKG